MPKHDAARTTDHTPAPEDPAIATPGATFPAEAESLLRNLGLATTTGTDNAQTGTSDGAAAAAGSAPPIQGYELLGELGRGGMGVVYKARQTSLNRLVALKMILGTRAADDPATARFLAEAESVAAIRHPNVVQVYDYGESDGRPYMALEFLSGGTLAARLTAPLAPHAPPRCSRRSPAGCRPPTPAASSTAT